MRLTGSLDGWLQLSDVEFCQCRGVGDGGVGNQRRGDTDQQPGSREIDSDRDDVVGPAELLGDRPAAVARELTKLFEEVRRASLHELARYYARHPDVKGEIVIVIGPPSEETAQSADTIDTALRTAMEAASVKDAAAEVAARYGLKRRDVYARALELKRGAA